VFDHVVGEIAAVLNRARGRGFIGEDARAVAAQLRTAIVRASEIDIDPPAKRAVQNLIRVRGGDAVFAPETDRARAKALLKRYNIDADDRWLDVSGLDDRTRNMALDGLVNDGITGALTRAVDAFENLAVTLDRMPGATSRVRRVQFDFNWYSFCWPLLADIQVYAAQASAICAAVPWYPGLETACAAMQAAVSALSAAYYAYCW
jgi:hypothetical protein